MQYIDINEIIVTLDSKHYELKHPLSSMIKSIDIFFLKNVTNEFIGKNIKINSSSFEIKNKEDVIISVEKENLIIGNCNFDRLDIKANFKNIFIYESQIKHLFIDNIEMESFRFEGEIDNLNISNGKFKEISIKSKSDAKSFMLNNLSVETLSLSVKIIDEIQLTAIKNCNELYINNESHEDATVINKLKCVWIDDVKLFEISPFKNIPITIKELELDRFHNIKTFIFNNITLETCILNGAKSYEEVILNFSHLNIVKSLKINDCNMKNSTFRNINLSKCYFDNSLIIDTKFYECDAEEISDVPLIRFKKFINWSTVILYIFSLFIFIYFRDYINEDFWIGFTTIIISTLILLSLASSIFVTAKHFRTLDETEKLKEENFFPNFIKGINPDEKKKLEEIESVYRQLKVSFEKDQNKQKANEFLYSENIIKLRQKTLFKNLVSVDLYNYLINGFGRRWRRALLNFSVLLLLTFVTFTFMADTYEVIENKAPSFLQKAKEKIFIKDTVEDNNISAPKDSLVFFENLLTISGTYTISKIDIFRIKTNGWFEEKSFLALFINNFIGVLLIFLFGSFILAFKRRLDK
ncbi:MAG: hypothetical protein WC279_10645 [Sulfurimonas sp.]|jgi:uncharacterized protein YjbI with pentapeptide repeats|uniref:hypothetical protein n=1 Tax=Sulfurimonas sp. TaxID=2022749 RepID=UPI00356925AA